MPELKTKTARLGRRHRDGVAPAFLPLVQRGLDERPEAVAGLRGRAVFRFSEEILPLRITFKPRTVIVEDGDLKKPNLVIAGRMADIVNLATAPHWRGMPKLTESGGRAAIHSVVRGHVRIDGNRRLARGLLRLLSV